VKLAICIPCYGDTKAKFTQSLAELIAHTASARFSGPDGEPVRVQIETFMVSSSILVESRHRLVGEALAWGADFMLWLDADKTFPHDAFARLWRHNLPVVGCNYPRRHTPTAPTAAYKDDDGQVKLLYTTREKAEAGLVEPCEHLGFGCCLVNMKVFDVLQAHAEEHGNGNFLPLFVMTDALADGEKKGEDVYFFGKLAEAGIKAFCDHGLSWEIGHIHEVILTNAHACVQQPQWDEFWGKRLDKFAKAAEVEAAA
jgi:hypothetical protein